MSSEEVFEKVKGIIVEQLGVADTAVTLFRYSRISYGIRRRI